MYCDYAELGIVTKHLSAHGEGDIGSVRYIFDDAQDGSSAHSEGVVDTKMRFDEWLHPGGERHYSPSGRGALGSTLAVDREAMPLPIKVVLRELGKLAEPETGIEQGPDDPPLPCAVAGMSKTVCLVLSKGFPFVLVGHDLTVN
jgi:hypothetical protein